MKERNPQRQRRTEKEVRKGSQNWLVLRRKKKSGSLNLLPKIATYVEYEFQARDFQPSESVGKCVGHAEIPLSPQESSNKDVVNQLQRQKPHSALDEELMEDGISISDLEIDLQEGQGSTSDLEISDEIFTDLGKDHKP